MGHNIFGKYKFTCAWCGEPGSSDYSPNQNCHTGECKRLHERKLREERKRGGTVSTPARTATGTIGPFMLEAGFEEDLREATRELTRDPTRNHRDLGGGLCCSESRTRTPNNEGQNFDTSYTIDNVEVETETETAPEGTESESSTNTLIGGGEVVAELMSGTRSRVQNHNQSVPAWKGLGGPGLAGSPGMAHTLKLYVWDGAKVPKGKGGRRGLAVAFAVNEAQARDMVARGIWGDGWRDEYARALKNGNGAAPEFDWLMDSPREVKDPGAFFMAQSGEEGEGGGPN